MATGRGWNSDLQQPGLRATRLSPACRARIPARSPQSPFQPGHRHQRGPGKDKVWWHSPIHPTSGKAAMFFPLKTASEIKKFPFFCFREGNEKKPTEMKKYKVRLFFFFPFFFFVSSTDFK